MKYRIPYTTTVVEIPDDTFEHRHLTQKTTHGGAPVLGAKYCIVALLARLLATQEKIANHLSAIEINTRNNRD